MKRIISMLLIFVLLLTSFPGCSGQSDDSAPDPQMLLGEGTVLSQQTRPESSQGSGETPFSSDPIVLSSPMDSSSRTDASSQISAGASASSQAAEQSLASQAMAEQGSVTQAESSTGSLPKFQLSKQFFTGWQHRFRFGKQCQ